VEAEPLKDERADTIIPILLRTFSRMGFPKKLLSDNGSDFRSAKFSTMCKKLGIQKFFCTAEHPRGDGQAENAVKIVQNALRAYVDANQTNWDELLPFCLFGFRTAIHNSTGDTPFFLLYGHDPYYPCDRAVQPDE